MKGRIRIRAPEDFPGRWTAIADIVPGEPYVYLSGDIAVEVRWLPEASDLRGMAKGMTGGVPSEVWVRRIRDAEPDPEDTCPLCDHEYKKHATGCPPPPQPLPDSLRLRDDKCWVHHDNECVECRRYWVRQIRDACDCGVDEYYGDWDHKQGHADTCPKHGQQEDS